MTWFLVVPGCDSGGGMRADAFVLVCSPVEILYKGSTGSSASTGVGANPPSDLPILLCLFVVDRRQDALAFYARVAHRRPPESSTSCLARST